MNPNNPTHIAELEAKIQILERENETLSAKAEENLLLNRAFEEIKTSDIQNVLANTLESISVILDVQFSGIFKLDGNSFTCISSYAQFINEDVLDINLSISDKAFDDLNKNGVLYENNGANYAFNYPASEFQANNIVIIAFMSEVMKNEYFVFANNAENIDLSDKVDLFEKVIEIISVKLDRYYYQNELEKLNDALEKKVEERTIALSAQNNEYVALNKQCKVINKELLNAKEHAEESDRLKTAFLQNMSHEIRTPMNAIMGFSSLLVDYLDDKKQLEIFSEIINSRCIDLLDIINDILDVSKIESGQVDVNIERVDLNEVFSEISTFFAEYQQKIEKHNIQFIMHPSFEDGNSIFLVDKVKLKQILINLISNAFKFTHKGLIKCGCTLHLDNNLVFYVSDTGVGIPQDKHELIFDRFSQLHHSDVGNVGGTGLGLSIVSGMIKLLEGEIWLESIPEKGSTFYFSLPAKVGSL